MDKSQNVTNLLGDIFDIKQFLLLFFLINEQKRVNAINLLQLYEHSYTKSSNDTKSISFTEVHGHPWLLVRSLQGRDYY